MKKQFLIPTAVLSLLVAASLAVLTAARGQQTAQTSTALKTGNYRISGPYTHKNLTVFLVHGEDLLKGHSFLTLQEALEQKKVIVYETKDVNELSISNLSNQDIYVQAGDIVRGGDQDRMISTDFIVPPNSGKMPIAAFCVEHGRWSRRGNEVNASFASSDNAVATKELKLAAKRSQSQSEVWDNVTVAQDKLSKNVGDVVNAPMSRSSLELSLADPKVKETTASYIDELANIVRDKADVIGYAFAINGQVNSADVYASRDLFVKLWPKLLKASAVEAIAKLDDKSKKEELGQADITSFLAESEKPAPAEKTVTRRVKLVTREDERAIFFETRDRQKNDAWVHRNYIKKD